MGIQGLLPLLKDVQQPVHVSSYAGKTLGVDAYVWLHRGAYGCARAIVLGDPTPRYIAHALSRIRMLQHFGVKPYLVFDGDKLPAKRGTEDDREQRRNDNLERANQLEREGNMQQARDLFSKCVDITPEMAFQLIKVLKQQDIPYVVAPYEADAQLAFLEAEGIIDGIITEDSDLLVFGCKTVLFKLDQAGNAIEMLQQRFWTNRQLALSGWTAVEFRQMAILSGCDYLPSIVGMGLKNAHRLLRRYKTVDKVLQAVRLEGKLRVPNDYAREFRKAELTFVHQRVFDPRTQRLVTLTPLPDGTHDDMLPFIGANIKDDVAIGVAQGVIDPITRMQIVDRVPKPLGMRSNSDNNIAAASSTPAVPHGLHRSITAPTTLQSSSAGVGSFYRASVGAAAKKKAVSREAGLQSLKNFFVGASVSSKENARPKAEERVKERVPLAAVDTNRKADASGTQSKFFAKATPAPTHTGKPDHAYLHLGGELTPPVVRKDPNDSGYWDEECHDMRDFVRSSSPPQATAASQALVVETQEVALATQSESTPSSSVAVVVPQTPSRGGRGSKRMRTESREVSSPESVMGSGFISSPATSSVRGDLGDVGDEEAPSSPSPAQARAPATRPQKSEDEEDVQAEPVTPLAVRAGAARKPVLQTSVSKLEAFRYSAVTPQHAQHKQQQQYTRETPTAASPSVLKLAASSTPVAAARPAKALKRSPTLVLGDEAESKGLFDRFRFSDQETRHVPL
ncbi:related to EXO1 - exonuclease which interacts with Msh2p [Moesziomyces antarcticus]|nr:related to EXO1 - exonuclease which interacts with Msh2p [Moesziomyces antarcticus]